MGRIISDIEVNGKKLVTLFDTGSLVTYITERALPEDAKCKEIVNPVTSHLVQKEHILTKVCIISGKLDGCAFPFQAFVVDSIGKVPETKRELDIVFGATGMETWDIKLDPRRKKLDLTGLKKREFVSF